MRRPNFIPRLPPFTPPVETGNIPDPSPPARGTISKDPKPPVNTLEDPFFPKRSNSPTGSWPSVSPPTKSYHSLRSTTPLGLKPTSKDPCLPQFGGASELLEPLGHTTGKCQAQPEGLDIEELQDLRSMLDYHKYKTVHIVYKAPFADVFFQRKLSIPLPKYSQSQDQGYAYIGFERHETMDEQKARKQTDLRWMNLSLNHGYRQDSPMAPKSKDEYVRWVVDKANPNESSRISVPVGAEGPWVVVVEWRMATVSKGKYYAEDKVLRRETVLQYGLGFPPFRVEVEFERVEGDDDQTHEARSTGSELSSPSNTVSLDQVEKSLGQEETHPVDPRCAPS